MGIDFYTLIRIAEDFGRTLLSLSPDTLMECEKLVQKGNNLLKELQSGTFRGILIRQRERKDKVIQQLQSRLEQLEDRKRFLELLNVLPEIEGFLAKDPAAQTSDEAHELEMKLQVKLYPEGPIKGKFRYNEKEQFPLNQRKQISNLLDKFNDRLDELYYNPPIRNKFIRPYLEPTKESFVKEWKHSLMAIRKFLANSKVTDILKKFQTLEDSVFVVWTLEPWIYLIHSNAVARFVDQDEVIEEDVTFGSTLTRGSTIQNAKTSKPGPKNEQINEIIVLLSIHFKECLGKEHYQWIADLLNLCPLLYKGKMWTANAVKMRISRLSKKEKRLLIQWRDGYDHRWFSCRDIGEESGLNELIRRYLPGKTDSMPKGFLAMRILLNPPLEMNRYFGEEIYRIQGKLRGYFKKEDGLDELLEKYRLANEVCHNRLSELGEILGEIDFNIAGQSSWLKSHKGQIKNILNSICVALVRNRV